MQKLSGFSKSSDEMTTPRNLLLIELTRAGKRGSRGAFRQVRTQAAEHAGGCGRLGAILQEPEMCSKDFCNQMEEKCVIFMSC